MYSKRSIAAVRFMLGVFGIALMFGRAVGGSIFDGTPFEGAAKTACNATGTCNLQKKLGLPNAGGAVGNLWEQAKKDARPITTAVTTLGCPGCVLAAGAVSGPGAVQDALFTTGVVTAAHSISPTLGLVSVVILGADKDSGEVGYEEVTVAENKAVHLHDPRMFDVASNCIVSDGGKIFALFLKPPAAEANIRDGDHINLSAPACPQVVAKGGKSLTSVRITKTGGNPIHMSEGRFRYLIVGTILTTKQ